MQAEGEKKNPKNITDRFGRLTFCCNGLHIKAVFLIFFFFLVFAVQRDHQRIVTSKWAKEEKRNVRNKFPITARVLKQGGGKYISLSPLLIIL